MNKLKSLPDKIPDDFWSKVKEGDPDACWPWQGAVNQRGYGMYFLDGKRYRAHRIVLANKVQMDYPQLSACHTCDNTVCCNPAHLYWGTHTQNMQDKIQRGRANPLKGIHNPRAKLNPDKVRQIRTLAETVSFTELARRFGVDRKAIWQIVQRVTWKEV